MSSSTSQCYLSSLKLISMVSFSPVRLLFLDPPGVLFFLDDIGFCSAYSELILYLINTDYIVFNLLI